MGDSAHNLLDILGGLTAEEQNNPAQITGKHKRHQ